MTFHLDARSQPDNWLNSTVADMLYSPSGFPFG